MLDWFADAKFGLFLHYGLYSLLGRGEWVQRHERIPPPTYAKLAESFTAERFDADEITDLALAAEMKYINLTTRHHDSFCLFESDQTDFTSTEAPNCGRDLVGELAEQCERKGLPLFLYYSYGLDWRHAHYAEPLTPMSRPTVRHRPRARDGDASYIDFVHAQLTELLTNYGAIAGIWFDPAVTYFRHRQHFSTEAHRKHFAIEETYSLIRKLQPECLISFKQGANGDEDFVSTERGIQSLGDLLDGDAAVAAERAWSLNRSRPYELCDTMLPHSWGHSTLERGHHRSASEIRQILGYANYRGSNLLLNTGLLGDGSIEPAQASTLGQVGRNLRAKGFPASSPNYPPHTVRAAESVDALRSMWVEGADRGPLLYFLHAPRTGGTSIVRLLRDAYPSASVRHNPPTTDVAERPRLERVAAVSSHLPRTVVAELFPTRSLLPITIVREPLSRLVSLYNDSSNRENHPWHERVKAMTPAQFFDALLPGPNQRNDIFGPGDFAELTNHQCLLIHGQSARTEDAQAVIASEFFAIGTTEQHDLFVRTLGEHLDWPVGIEAAVRNVSEHTLKVEDLEPGLRDRLQEFNEQDALLYEYVSQLPGVVVNSYDSLVESALF